MSETSTNSNIDDSANNQQSIEIKKIKPKDRISEWRNDLCSKCQQACQHDLHRLRRKTFFILKEEQRKSKYIVRDIQHINKFVLLFDKINQLQQHGIYFGINFTKKLCQKCRNYKSPSIVQCRICNIHYTLNSGGSSTICPLCQHDFCRNCKSPLQMLSAPQIECYRCEKYEQSCQKSLIDLLESTCKGIFRLKTLMIIVQGIAVIIIVAVLLAYLLVGGLFYSLYYAPKKTIQFAQQIVFHDDYDQVTALLLIVPYLIAVPFLLIYYVLKGIFVGSSKLWQWTADSIYKEAD